MKRQLSNVTLMGIDCVNVERLQKALDISSADIEFASVKLLTSLPTSDPRKVEIPHIGTIEAFSDFAIRDLHDYVDTEFVLLVQYDGFILNPDSWEDDFLTYDYVGAPWVVSNHFVKQFNFPKDSVGTRIVGNGGFCLRSRKFVEASARLAKQGSIPVLHPEDVAMCVWNRAAFEREGMRFAPPEIAERFSIEGHDDVYDKQFGFHGLRWTDISKWIRENPEWKVENPDDLE